MKPSREKDFTKRGTFPLHTTRNGLVRSSLKKRSQLNPNNTKPRAGPRYSYNCDDVIESTPLNNKNTIKDEADNDDDDGAHKTPPVEASVSPEIQMMSSTTTTTTTTTTATTTPATGHHPHHHIHTAVSGIADNRKCRARGLLSATNKLSDPDADSETSLPLPSHASMRWLDHHSPTFPFAINSSPVTSTCKSNSSTNVIRTPTSADSQLDSVTESLRTARIDFSFEFDAVAAASISSSSSVDLSHFRPHQLLRDSCCSETDDVDRSDCCRLLSEDDDDNNDDENPNIVFDEIVSALEPEARQHDYASGSCAESISINGGDPLASKDSDWDFDQQL